MASIFRVLFLIAAMACVVTVARPMEPAAEPECGRQAADAVCLFGRCCSADGQCGAPGACGAGCQSGPCEDVVATEPAAECGKHASYAECWPRSQCCSAGGMCGTGDAFCGNGCQGGSCYVSPLNLD